MVVIEEKIKSAKHLQKTLRRLIDEKMNPLLHDYNQNDKSKVLAIKSKLNEKLSTLQKVNNEVLGLIEDEDAYEDYQNKADDFEIEIEEVIINIDSIILKPETEPVIHPLIPQVVPPPTPHQNHNIKLPRIDIKKFSGDVTEWQTFFDSFEVAVHSNDKLYSIKKMNYLLSYLTGEALKTVQGLKLPKPKYSAAIEMLQERYGDKQVLISTHMNKLLNLSNSGNLNDLKYLRQLYNNIDTQVRSLTSLGMDPDRYGPMMITVVMSKLPENLKLNITRQFGQDLWDIKLILESFKNELAVLEKLSLTKATDKDEFEFNTASGTCLYTAQGESTFSCVFCHQKHKPQHCKTVTKIETIKSILRKKGKCFLCPRDGHVLRNCTQSFTCFKCEGF